MRVCARSSPFRVKASAKVMALKKFRMRGNQAAKCEISSTMKQKNRSFKLIGVIPYHHRDVTYLYLFPKSTTCPFIVCGNLRVESYVTASAKRAASANQ